MKILHLVLYSHSPDYDDMFKSLSILYKTFEPSVTTIFYTYSSSIEEDYILKENILYIKGEESYIPGILEKTVRALVILRVDMLNYDYVVRSNISTVINFKLLMVKLQSTRLHYASSNVTRIEWFDANIGLTDDKYFNIPFAVGSSLIFSVPFLMLLMQEFQSLDNSLIDDLAIGVLVQKKFPTLIPYRLGDYLIVYDYEEYILSSDTNSSNSIVIKDLVEHIIFFRNHCKDRSKDSKRIKDIVEEILRKSSYHKVTQ